jgi:Glu-tRNA(Gln) amidotransferase subunit E-like FAD-binding protein
MGTYIGLSLLPRGITQQDWETVYEESLNLLRAYPFADKQKKMYFETEIPVYVQSKEKIEQVKYWSTCGDLSSKRYGETFMLYRDFTSYSQESNIWDEVDIMFEQDSNNILEVFDSKTLGYDYHLYVLAIAMH